MFHQAGQNLKFVARQFDVLSVCRCRTSGRIQGKAVDAWQFRFRFFAASAEDGPDTRNNRIYIDDNTLSVNMTRLRAKLDGIGLPEFIKTRRGI